MSNILSLILTALLIVMVVAVAASGMGLIIKVIVITQ